MLNIVHIFYYAVVHCVYFVYTLFFQEIEKNDSLVFPDSITIVTRTKQVCFEKYFIFFMHMTIPL